MGCGGGLAADLGRLFLLAAEGEAEALEVGGHLAVAPPPLQRRHYQLHRPPPAAMLLICLPQLCLLHTYVPCMACCRPMLNTKF